MFAYLLFIKSSFQQRSFLSINDFNLIHIFSLYHLNSMTLSQVDHLKMRILIQVKTGVS